MKDFIINKQGKKILKKEIRRIGVTGLFASGKTTACCFFQEMGANVLDMDILAREVIGKGTELYYQVVEYFISLGFSKKTILDKDKNLNRKAVAKIVFANKKILAKLNSFIHPAVIRLAEEQMATVLHKDNLARFALDIPLLYEAGLLGWVDIVIVVNTPVELSIKRGMQRDRLARKEVLSRIQHQIPLNKKIPLADYIIENRGSQTEIKNQIIRIWRDISTLD